MREVRIGIVGSAGTGKTSLGRELASALGVPFLAAKDITSDILTRDGYDYATGIQVERFLAHGSRQDEMLERTLELHTGEGSFVTDRTLVDLAAYAVCELHASDTRRVRRIFDACRQGVRVYTHLFVCPWLERPLEDNRRRTLNPWYQFVIHGIALGLLQRWGASYRLVDEEETSERVAELLELLESSG